MIGSQDSSRRRIIWLVVLAIAGFVYGSYLMWEMISFNMTAIETDGRVVGRAGSKFTIKYIVDGRSFLITEDLPGTKGMSGLKSAALRPGARVRVLYDPASPVNGRWKSDRNWVFPGAVMLVSLMAGLAGMFPNVAGGSLRRS